MLQRLTMLDDAGPEGDYLFGEVDFIAWLEELLGR